MEQLYVVYIFVFSGFIVQLTLVCIFAEGSEFLTEIEPYQGLLQCYLLRDLILFLLFTFRLGNMERLIYRLTPIGR